MEGSSGFESGGPALSARAGRGGLSAVSRAHLRVAGVGPGRALAPAGWKQQSAHDGSAPRR